MKYRSLIAIVAAGALVLAACGDDDDDAAGEATTTPVAVATTEAAVETTEPAVETTEPAPTTEPAVETTEPAPTTEPAVETTEPAPTTEPAVETTEPAVETTEPTPTTEPAVETTEPAVETTEPAPTTEPAVETTEPAPTTEPAVATTEPAPTTEPVVETTEPVVETTEPAPTTEPAVETTEPAPTTEPAVETTEPAPTTEPVVETTEPVVATTEPAPTTEPAVATTEPTPTTEPVVETTEPAPTTEPVVATTEVEIPTSSVPGVSGIDFPITPPPNWPDSLTFTLTPSQEAGGLIDTAQPLADALAERLGVEVEALVPTDYAGVIVALQSGQAQIAGGLGPLQMVQAEEEAGADLILQSERFGSFEYVTQWFTNDPDTYCSDEPVANDDGFLFCNGVLDADNDPSQGPIGEDAIALAEGTTVAFVDQGSASGYLVPALQLLQAGIDPTTGIEPLFAGGHDSAVQAVYDGDADIGVSFNDARGQLVETTPDVGEQVVVFAWSFPIPNDGFAVAAELPDDLKEAIAAAFVDIAATEDGAALLDELYEIDGLTPVESTDFDIIRELRTELADLLE